MLKILKVRDVKTPTRANNSDSWIDFFVPNMLNAVKIKTTATQSTYWEDWEDELVFNSMWKLYLLPWQWILIPSWIRTIIQEWYDLVLQNKSWVAVKKWLIIWAQVIDSSYRWEIHLHLINTSRFKQIINLWEKITQWILRKVELNNPEEITEEEFEKYSNTERWTWGFWSTWV